MAKDNRELAFVRDLLGEEWTGRFNDLIDGGIDLKDSENLLYLNAGTGGHPIAIAQKYEDVDIFASTEDEELLKIARDKAAAANSKVDFSMIRFDDDAFDTVVADASFVPPSKLDDIIEYAVRTAKAGGDVAFVTPTAGSFGEIFSLLWEVLVDDEAAGTLAESIIGELPTVSDLESAAERFGLVNITSKTENEAFEFENGIAFAESPLVTDFLMPQWIGQVDEERQAEILKKLADLIDEEDGTMPFRFSVKATIVAGERS